MTTTTSAQTTPSGPETSATTAAPRRRRRRIGRGRVNWPATILLAVGSLTVLVPLFVTVNMSLKSTSQAVQGNAFALPDPLTLESFVAAWNLTNFPRGFAISVFITVVAVVGEILISSMAAYAIVRNWDRRLYRWSFYYLLAAMFIPFPVVALPQIKLTGMLGLDNPLGVAILHIAFALAFNTLLLTAFLRTIPVELEESMRIDGAGTWRVFWRLILPLLAPMCATVGIFAFIQSWNDFMMPSLIISDPTLQTIPVLQNMFQTQFSNSYNVAFSSYLMAMAPAVIVFLVAQRWVMSGLTQGAVK
ncbi:MULTISPECIES: carbohydrate ABC transporter permease [Brachybacterium]|uniref:Raffinose/stachyose/melibiose transport system permease protein n=1 Tax=Brachybacterium fresconis TaxID=173363 RepID=A0ABS4YND5_9MICO|nr:MULTISPECIES: carbohydrate ABC transporter permease [Brachybacterium]MBP2410301.1 raffinose/stachyose/melibiose transport system permease protein [Brachybacterium fresconis]MDN5685592.1 carbohydrate ABC transporter permease [Brachybacterium sp.]